MMHVGDIMSTSGMFSTSGGIMSTPGDVQYIGGYHDACGVQVGKNLSISIENSDD